MSLKLAQRITCDEDERQRFGDKLVTAYRFPEVNGRLERNDAEVLCDDVPVLTLSVKRQMISLRKKAGLTQERMAELLGTRKSNISRLESLSSDSSPRLSTRAAAGPFRSFGRIAVEPRPCQLVPLMMALKLEPVRLLIADDVGIGKTIEACLIARELLDRAEIRRIAVLCPPHLAEQWQRELAEKFHIEAELVLSSTIARLERDLPLGVSVFDRHPFTTGAFPYSFANPGTASPRTIRGASGSARCSTCPMTRISSARESSSKPTGGTW